jgi:secreted Zn-dependent insulinase-like peptidase
MLHSPHRVVFLCRGWNALRGINVRILSQRFSPPAMETALWAFLSTQRAILRDTLTEEIVAARCQAIIRSLEDPPTTYSEEASDHWDSIVNAMPFDWTQQVIAQLKELDRQAVLSAAEEWVFDAATRRSMSMMIFSPQHEQERVALKETVTAQACASSEPGARYCFSIDEMKMLRDSLTVASQQVGE